MDAQRKGPRKLLFAFVVALITVLLSATVGAAGNPAYADDPQPPAPIGDPIQANDYLTVQNYVTADGKGITRTIINGPPEPPPGYEVERDAVGVFPAAAKTLTVPAYTWVFGCSAVSAAMIAGYYDRNGYPKMYTGPKDGGVMPMTNVWGKWYDGYKWYPNNPLIASHKGVDGRTIRGSIDDYWVKYKSTAPDPYIGHWVEHSYAGAIGDYMKTSQSAHGNTDGSTNFHTWTTSPSKLTCADMVTNNIDHLDGTFGRKLFYQAKGYTVTECYNQKTSNNSGGFTFANYKAQIDANRPVLLNLAGHSVVGVGYDNSVSPPRVYIHNTWDTGTPYFTWGTTAGYSGMKLLSVSVVNISSGSTSGFNSQFNGSAAGWVKRPGAAWSLASGTTYYTTGVAGKVSSVSYNATFGNYTYQARVKRTDYAGDIHHYSAGLVVRGTPTFDAYNDWKNAYEFLYTQTGHFSVWKGVGGSWTLLKDWTSSSSIVPNGWNTLKLVASGTSLRFYINGTLVWAGSDSAFSSGQVGLWMFRGSPVERFDADWATLTVGAADVLASEPIEQGQVELPFDPAHPYSRFFAPVP